MFSIIRGTTPTILWKFSTAQVGEITSAYLTIKRKNIAAIEKGIADASINVEENTISWTLTQEDTLQLKEFKEYELHCDWLLNDNVRGAGTTAVAQVLPAGKDEVIW